MIKTRLFTATIVLLIFSACQNAIKPESLYGKWKYVKVENTDIRSTTNTTPEQLESEIPYIQFSKNDSLMIWWGGRVLTHGTYKLEGNNILVKEILEGGKTREFPFIVSKLDDKNLIFETKGDESARVTAVKLN